eukprot:COSAG01_NODE_94_length_26962_cov_9.110933_29_plen_86_part_00
MFGVASVCSQRALTDLTMICVLQSEESSEPPPIAAVSAAASAAASAGRVIAWGGEAQDAEQHGHGEEDHDLPPPLPGLASPAVDI